MRAGYCKHGNKLNFDCGGCRIERTDHIAAIRAACIKANPARKWTKEVFGAYSNSQGDTHDLPVRLADVLLALYKNCTAGQWDDALLALIDNQGGLMTWNLRTDDLEQQSDETVAFIASLLSTSTGDGG